LTEVKPETGLPATEETVVVLTEGPPPSVNTVVTATLAPREPTEGAVNMTTISDEDGMVLLFVPEGEFWMGSEDWKDDEIPRTDKPKMVYRDLQRTGT
jgi:hypothetical protein